MCGIAGEVWLGGRPDAAAVRRMADALAHRGPDAEGFFTDGPAALGHRRLSILDIEGGVQPMTDAGVTLLFNGQAYDFAELRDELRKKGHQFRTRSDTEVVLKSYLEWGEQFVERVHGMFAVALWDSRSQKLLLARDRLGKKPLYYSTAGGKITFASELKAFIAHGGFERKVEPKALVQYLAVEYVPAPHSIFAGIDKLPAGSIGVFDASGFRIRRYWEIPSPQPQAAGR